MSSFIQNLKDFFNSIPKMFVAFLILLLLLALGGYILLLRYENGLMQQAINQQNIDQKQLKDYIDRSSSSYISQADFDAFVKKQGIDLQAIKDDMKNFNSQIKGIVTTQASSIVQNYYSGGTYVPTPIPSSIPVVNGYASDINNWYGQSDTLALNEKFTGDNAPVVPFGSVTFSAQKPKGSEWDVNIYPRSYTMNTVITTTEDRDRLIDYSQFQINSNGSVYKIPVQSQTKEVYPTAQMRWHIQPFLFAGAGYTTSGVSTPFGVGTSFGSYGQYSKNPEMTLFDVGLSYDPVQKSVAVSFAPVSYNIGSLLSIFSNTYVTAGVTYGFDKSFGGYLCVKLEL